MFVIALSTILGYRILIFFYDIEYRIVRFNKKLYQVAEAFADGMDSEEVEANLINKVGIDQESAKSIVKKSLKYRKKKQAYKNFIKITNKVLGIRIYDPKYKSD
ncbi:hypothetical protein ACSRNZ_002825 [Listeria monocytogenes]